MIGLGMNILVRYLAQDDEKQSKLVTKLIENKYDKNNRKMIFSHCLKIPFNKILKI